MEFTIDELTALTLTNGRAANHARKAAELLLKVAEEHDHLAQIYLEAGKRIGRETEAKESKVKLRGIITSIVVMILVGVLMMGSLTLAQDVTPDAVATEPVTSVMTDYPADVTPGTTQQPVNGEPTGALNTVLDKVIIIGAIIGLILVAFKTAGLVPKETFDSAMNKAFALAKDLTSLTKTPLDDAALDLLKPGLEAWLNAELERRTKDVTAKVQNPTFDATGYMPGSLITQAMQQAAARPEGK